VNWLISNAVNFSFWFLKNHQNQKKDSELKFTGGSIVSDVLLWHFFVKKCQMAKLKRKHYADTTVHYQIICTESCTGRQQTSLFLAISCCGLRLLFKFFPAHFVKVHKFWEGNTILRNLHRRFDRYYIGFHILLYSCK
jgi:hypothetical protein